MKGELIY